MAVLLPAVGNRVRHRSAYGGFAVQVGWNHNPAWVVLRPMGGVKFAQSWVELQPDFGGITTHGWGEVRPELGGITTRLRWNYDLRVG